MQNIYPILSHDKSLLIKIGDFGASKIPTEGDALKTAIGTWAYQAPEVNNDEEYTFAVDIWSLGYLFVTLLTGGPLFPNRKAFNLYAYGSQGGGVNDPPKALLDKEIEDKDAIDLITGMLQIEPLNRPSAKKALDHVWFQNHPETKSNRVTEDIYNHFEEVLRGNGPILRRCTIDQLEENNGTIVPSSGEAISIIYLP